MTYAEKIKIIERANKVIDELTELSDSLMKAGDYDRAHKENHKAQGALELTRVLLNEMESMQ